ncbi:FMN-binding negative transcriptional regulator [Novosphingobium sp. AP12]|uniref:FMN-binding negative transcriptional regulator n=1 Tax=Novosphingobium sp. AP12 TaxID=1144305 RepID=UPI000271DD31|nr:FMN-binding negative transcriptional regulator [Novosphingobium sp. AP12]EJL31870.1 transcriptional regulator [Novosphingobium sp. AP12]
MNELFAAYGPQDVRFLIEQYPLAWVQSCADGDEVQSALLPLVGEYDEQGKLVALIGHMARHNPLHDALRGDHRASILFTGPQGYVSPEHAGLRDWAPTWNYVQLRVAADLHFDDALTGPALEILIDEMERARAVPWSKEELGERYSRLAGAIIGFRAEIRSCAGIFKLGQDERPEVLAHILASHPDPVMVEWMHRFNP